MRPLGAETRGGMRAWSNFNLTVGGRQTLWLALCLFFAPGLLLARDKPTQCVIAGETYRRIFDVHVTTDGRIAILYSVGGITVDRGDVPKAFLEAWGVASGSSQNAAPGGVEANADYLRYMQKQELDAVIQTGLIRRVDDSIYDLRRPQPGWEKFTDAKISFIDGQAAVLELPDRPADKRFVIIKNLPMVGKIEDTVTAWAKLVGMQRFTTKTGSVLMPVYDYGHVCDKNEVPVSILTSGVVDHSRDSWASGLTNSAPPLEAAEAHAMGSGFFVSPDGYVLTSYHVVARASKVRVNYGGTVLPAIVARVDQTNDLALLKTEGHDFKWLSLSHQPTAILGEFVFTIGFPNPSLQGWEPKYSDGNISGLDGLQDDPREYQTSVAIQPGNSGGPVCDSNGEVLGVVRAELSPKVAFLSGGALPQNVNYAVKAKYALPLLEASDIAPASPGSSSGDAESVRDRVRSAVVMVLAE